MRSAEVNMNQHKLICTWIPGTLDRIRVKSPYGTYEISIDSVRHALGRPAIQDLYLTGRHTIEASEARVLAFLDQLGCTLPHHEQPALTPEPKQVKAPLAAAHARSLSHVHADQGGFN